MKRKPPQRYADFEPEFSDDDFNAESDMVEEDVPELCGDRNAKLGRALFFNRAVTQRSFDGQSIHATIQNGAALLPVVLNLEDWSNSCSESNHARQVSPNCEHIAALMFAYIYESATFLPQTPGEFIQLINQNPAAREQLADPQLAALLKSIETAPPQNLAQAAPALQVFANDQRRAQLNEYLSDLSVSQLQAIAKRRGWKFESKARDAMTAQLAKWLAAASPLEVGFTPEEEQLLKLANTLYGLEGELLPVQINAVWKKRSGNNLERLNAAYAGLQTAGLLFPCTRESGFLHYHWSPYLAADQLPVYTPKIKLYPTEKISQLRIGEPQPVLTVFDAVIEFAAREPLQVRPRLHDVNLDRLPYIGEWDYDPAEVAPLSKSKYLNQHDFSIPLPAFWTDDTLDVLTALIGVSREGAGWFAEMLFALQLVQPSKDGRATLNDETLEQWRLLTPDDQTQLLWKSWCAGAVAFDDLQRTATRASLTLMRFIGNQLAPLDLTHEIGAARRFIARLLAPLDPLTWYSWKAFTETTREMRPDFAYTTTRENEWYWIATKTRHRYQLSVPAHWDATFRPFLATLFEDLQWLGVLELALDSDGIAAFRLSVAGTWLLSNGKTEHPVIAAANVPVDGDAVTWLSADTFRLRATPDVAPLARLARVFADSTRAVLTFQVTPNSLARALERGVASRELSEKFAPMPETVRAQLATLEANYGRAHLYEHLTVIELSDDLALRELIAGTSLAQQIVHQFSPRLVVVRDESVDALIGELVKKGYTPRTIPSAT